MKTGVYEPSKDGSFSERSNWSWGLNEKHLQSNADRYEVESENSYVEFFHYVNDISRDAEKILTDHFRSDAADPSHPIVSDADDLLELLCLPLSILYTEGLHLEGSGFRHQINTLRIGMAYQRMLLRKTEELARYGYERKQHLRAAREARTIPVTKNDIEQRIAELQRAHPNLSLTQHYKQAAKGFNIALRTLYRRIGKEE